MKNYVIYLLFCFCCLFTVSVFIFLCYGFYRCCKQYSLQNYNNNQNIENHKLNRNRNGIYKLEEL